MSQKIFFGCMGILTGVLSLVFLTVQPFYGQNQEVAATLSGTVTDPTGLALSGASVTLTSVQIGVVRTYTTREGGLFAFTLLPPAVYTLNVNVTGFKDYKQLGITLAAGQSAQQTADDSRQNHRCCAHQQ